MIMSETPDPRHEAFGYECGRCLRCCRDKHIQLNPYEVARLARLKGETTTAFRETWTEGGAGLALSRTADGACVFLGSTGCTVHPDRPLVCRVYPLGRHLTFDGVESFIPMEPHPLSEGELHQRGTIGDFLIAQGAEPYILAADAYVDWLARAIDILADYSGKSAHDVIASPIADDRLLDMDAALASWSRQTGQQPPDDIDHRTALHLSILDDHLNAPGDPKHGT